MKKYSLVAFHLAIILICHSYIGVAGNFSVIYQTDTPTIEGRWDLTIEMDGKQAPSWLEVRHSGTHILVGQFVGASGSARPVSRVNYKDGKMSFTIPPQWEKGENDITVEGTLNGDNLSGTINTSDGKTFQWTGVRAPSLTRSAKPAWGNPVNLLSAGLQSWHTEGVNQWVVEGGILRSPHTGVNLITNKTFSDFKLHIEFRCPKESNSGVYLRGRYEAQVADSKGKEPLKDQLGAIYGFLAPNEMAAKEAGEWQTYDITLLGRLITVVLNGKTVISNQQIPGITGGALNSREGDPGPLMLQGDHGPIDYRNIIITPAK